MRLVLVLVGLIQAICLLGQDTQVLTFQNYIEIVKTHHPVTYQANLIKEIAVSNSLMAKGGFDPKIEGSWNKKSFDDKNYYSIASGKVKVPTWFGAELNAGYDRNSGEFLNESDFIPSRGIWNAGISVPLGKGLIIDNRRAELKKAEIFNSASEQEQILLLNDIVYDASLAYLELQAASELLSITLEGLSLAKVRFEGTRSGFINGDKPAIDTLESFINLETRQLENQKALQEIENKKIYLNNFLWLNGDVPVELEENISPEVLDINFLSQQLDSLSIIQDQWIFTHPEILLYDFKIANLKIDQRLAKEDLKPDLRINYNPLVAVGDASIFDEFLINNYKFGATLSYSLIQRKERGKIQLNSIKIEDTKYNQKLKNQDLIVKLDLYLNNVNQTVIQHKLLSKIVNDYNTMLIGESRKFSLGESSLFLVNSRESKYLESRTKLIQLTNKAIKYRYAYILASGSIGNIL